MATARAEISNILNQLVSFGWRVPETKGHPVAYPPNKSLSPVTIASSPGTRRWRLTLAADLRRRGFDLDGTVVKPLPITATAAQPTPDDPPAAAEPPQSIREESDPVTTQTIVEPVTEPAVEPIADPEEIVDIRPAPTGIGGRRTDKVMEVVYADGRTRYQCTECPAIRETAKMVFHHRRVHNAERRLQSVQNEPERAVEQAPEPAAEVAALIAEAACEQAELAEVTVTVPEDSQEETAATPEPEPEVQSEPEEPDVVAEVERSLATVSDLLSGLIAEADRLREVNGKLQDALRRAERARDGAEEETAAWRRRADDAEAKLARIQGVFGAA